MSYLKMILLPTSSNKKTGDVIQSYSSRVTCPTSCKFKKNGCYADGYHTARQWDRCDNTEDARYVTNGKQLEVGLKAAVCDKLRKDPTRNKILFRHNIAGDIAIEGTSTIDANRVDTIAKAIANTNKTIGNVLQGYTYTHCTINNLNAAEIIHEAASKGFLINASCETVQEVKHAKSFGINAVIASIDPNETARELKALGMHGVQCPAQTKDGVSCDSCRLCARDRDAVVIFGVHGTASKKAAKVIMLKKNKAA